MVHVTGAVRIAASPELVFDTVADTRNEPLYNPAMTRAELLTPEPLGLGTRFRAWMGRGGLEMVVELTEFERPKRLGSFTTSALMVTSGGLSFVPDAVGGTVMRWDWQVHPKGWLRILRPVMGPLAGRTERRIWGALKRRLEEGAAPGSA